jgi:hypothetical protein
VKFLVFNNDGSDYMEFSAIDHSTDEVVVYSVRNSEIAKVAETQVGSGYTRAEKAIKILLSAAVGLPTDAIKLFEREFVDVHYSVDPGLLAIKRTPSDKMKASLYQAYRSVSNFVKTHLLNRYPHGNHFISVFYPKGSYGDAFDAARQSINKYADHTYKVEGITTYTAESEHPDFELMLLEVEYSAKIRRGQKLPNLDMWIDEAGMVRQGKQPPYRRVYLGNAGVSNVPDQKVWSKISSGIITDSYNRERLATIKSLLAQDKIKPEAREKYEKIVKDLEAK